jgi:hypothetical protein
VIVWERGRPARNEREARKWIESTSENLRAVDALRDARVPKQSLELLQALR